MTIPRNQPCPCGSGKRYKHCCGGAGEQRAPGTETNELASLMLRALEAQRAGHHGAAAELYEAALAIAPDTFDALNMLAVIRAAEGRIQDAFELSRRAGELSDWSVELVNHNFTYIARIALANAESARVARLLERYHAWLESASAPGVQPASVSVLLFDAPGHREVIAAIDALAATDTPPSEVLVPADLAPERERAPAAIRVRAVPAARGSVSERLNALADAAEGSHLLAMPAAATGDTRRLAALLSAVVPARGWSIAIPETASGTGTAGLLAQAPTAGFALLVAGERVSLAGALLVSRELHERVGGYADMPNPQFEYALRLLWQAEPVGVRYAAASGAAEPPALRAEPPSEALSAYLRTATGAESPPNEFAPALGRWGVFLYSQVVAAGLFPAADVMKRMTDAISAHLERKLSRIIRPEPGLNLVGPARGEFGLAENMRAFARACHEGGVPFSVRDLNLALQTRQADLSLAAHFAEEALHDCSVFFLNPDSRQLYEQSLDAVVFERTGLDFRHYKIGYWFWELEKIPDQWSSAIAKVDEIWAATEFVANAIRKATDKPVIKIPTPISFQVAGRYDRARFELPDRAFVFLFSFDFNSFAERKNPHGLIRAFRQAFPAHREDVALVVKSINGSNRPDAVEELLDVARHDPRVLLRDGFMSRDEVFGLQSVIDCFVSLHRAEGLGLGLAECMYQGKPVIGTGYSGNLEFMNEENSALVRYSVVPIRKGEYLYDDPGFFWADPDEDHAAHLMRRMVDDAQYRERLAARGQQTVRTKLSSASAAGTVAQRLRQIGILPR